MRRQLPLLIGFISGLPILMKYFWNNPALAKLSSQTVVWRTIVAAFALGLGALNLIQAHIKNISRREKDWEASILLLLSLGIFTFFGLTGGTTSPIYKWGFDFIYQPVYSGIASLLAFTITSASYRAFKVKDWQSALLMFSGIVVMLGQIGLGAYFVKSIPAISQWLMDIPNTAGSRGITIGAALGAIAMSLRMLLGLERGYLGGAD